MTARMVGRLESAQEFADCAANFGSPDDRSIPFVLHGILHALIAIAERMPEEMTLDEYGQYAAEHAARMGDQLRAMGLATLDRPDEGRLS